MSASDPSSPRKLIVGLTGGIGCGKSTLLQHLRSFGCACCDDDAIVHSLYSPGGAAVEPLRRLFGEGELPLETSGALSRAKLSALIQSAANPGEALRGVEAVVHPLVFQAKKAFIDSASSWLVILDTPLLLEGLHAQGVERGPGYLDAIILVACATEVQRRRCLARPEMTEQKLELILQRQMKAAERLAYADFVVDTAPAGLDTVSSQVAGRSQAAGIVGQLAARHGGPLQLKAVPRT
ncbi:unnamed protein product, partial [Polarella glacialis]